MPLGIHQLIDASLVQQSRFDSISHNLANSATNAFKKEVISFDQTLSIVARSVIDFTVGPIVRTENETDLALEGQGFFKVRTAEGTQYTRDGAFSLNRDRVLVTRSGDVVLGKDGPITIQEGNFRVDNIGQVYADNQMVGTLSIVEFRDPQLLSKAGGSNYTHSGQNPNIVEAGDPAIKQGYLEKSNVGNTEEMIKMIETFRAYESVQKAIQSIGEMISKMVNDPGLIW